MNLSCRYNSKYWKKVNDSKCLFKTDLTIFLENKELFMNYLLNFVNIYPVKVCLVVSWVSWHGKIISYKYI